MKHQKRSMALHTDECGNQVEFEIPFGALFMNTGIVRTIEEMKVELRREKLIEKHYRDMDRPERMIWSDDDRMDFAKKMRRVKRVV